MSKSKFERLAEAERECLAVCRRALAQHKEYVSVLRAEKRPYYQLRATANPIGFFTSYGFDFTAEDWKDNVLDALVRSGYSSDLADVDTSDLMAFWRHR